MEFTRFVYGWDCSAFTSYPRRFLLCEKVQLITMSGQGLIRSIVINGIRFVPVIQASTLRVEVDERGSPSRSKWIDSPLLSYSRIHSVISFRSRWPLLNIHRYGHRMTRDICPPFLSNIFSVEIFSNEKRNSVSRLSAGKEHVPASKAFHSDECADYATRSGGRGSRHSADVECISCSRWIRKARKTSLLAQLDRR